MIDQDKIDNFLKLVTKSLKVYADVSLTWSPLERINKEQEFENYILPIITWMWENAPGHLDEILQQHGDLKNYLDSASKPK